MNKRQSVEQGYHKSMQRFQNIDGDNYGGCLKQIYSPKDNVCLEWRIHKKMGDMHIIEYYPDGNGYTVYKS